MKQLRFITLFSFAIFLSVSLYLNSAFAVQQAKVLSGDNVYSILRRYGFNDNQRKAALSHSLLPKDFVLSPGDIYRVTKNAAKGVTEIKFFSKKDNSAFLFWRDKTQAAGANNLTINYEVRTQKASGRIRGSLVESISKVVGDELVAYRFMDAFLLDYNLIKKLQKNAPFTIEYEKLYHQGQFVRYGEVRRAKLEIAGVTVDRKFKQLKTGGVFYDTEEDFSERPFYAPVDYIRISSLFQPRRFHPIKKYRRAHEGIDFELNSGEPISAIANGTVLRIGRNRASGNYIVLRHSGGYESYYNHMSRTGNFNVGDRVTVGEEIGAIGCTGYCTKPHLHFAIKRNSRFINPINLIKNHSYAQRKEVLRLIARRDD
jgi:murein DD-endopeptidase MepM/ murein hydrolase activator NlpD